MQRTQYTLAAVSEKHRKVRARRAACDPRQFVRALVHVSSHHFGLAEAVDGTEFKALVPLFHMMNAPDGASDANVELLPRLMSLQGGASRRARSIASSRAAGELELVCTAAVDIPSGHELYRHYYAGHGSEVSAQRYFGVFGWLPQHLAADEPKVSKAIAKARALAEKDCEAHADSMGATTSLALRSWPTPPSHCTRMSHRGAEPRERQRVSLSGLRRTHSRDLYEGKEEPR